jgi:hypothetical protein
MIDATDLPCDFDGSVWLTTNYGTSGVTYACRIYDSLRDIDVAFFEDHATIEEAESFALSEYKKELKQHRAEQRDYTEPSLSAWERN